MKRWVLLVGLVALGAGALAIGSGVSAKSGGKTITLVKRFGDYRISFLDREPKSPTGQPDHISPGT